MSTQQDTNRQDDSSDDLEASVSTEGLIEVFRVNGRAVGSRPQHPEDPSFGAND